MNKETLIQKYNSNKNIEFLGFFGGLNSREINTDIFSNFYPANFKLKLNNNEFEFTSTEQFFMWYKAKKFGDEIIANEILNLGYNPKAAKRLGRKVKKYDEKVWDEVREKVMYTGLKLKFTQNDELLNYLLKTNEKVLVEASPWDKIWGCGKGLNESYSNPTTWTGDNKLGFLLMKLRDELNTKG